MYFIVQVYKGNKNIMFKSIHLKKNNNLSNPFHSGYKSHLVEKSSYEIKTEKMEQAYKSKLHGFISFTKLCLYKKNLFKKIAASYNDFVYRDVVINPYHKPEKHTFLRKVYVRRIPESIFLKAKPYLGFAFMPFYPLSLLVSKIATGLQNRKVKKIQKKMMKKHFNSFLSLHRYKIFSIRENKRRIKKELKKRNVFSKIMFNKFSLTTLAVSLSIAGGVVANPTYDNRNITNIFNEGGDVTMNIYPTDSIDNVTFTGNGFNAYYSKNSNIEFYLPSESKFMGKSGSLLTNVRAIYSGRGNYIYKPNREESDWFQNIGIKQENCSSSLYLVNLKHITKEDGSFTVKTDRLSEPNRLIDVVYEITNDKVLYYIKDYDYYTSKREKKGSFVCEVEKEKAFHNKINKIVKKM
jgi:hypothetical protein